MSFMKKAGYYPAFNKLYKQIGYKFPRSVTTKLRPGALTPDAN